MHLQTSSVELKEKMGKGLPFIVAGPTGGGKTTIVSKALEILVGEGYDIERMVTYTTRPMRANEEDGVDYHFLSKDKFLDLQSKGFFFEHTEYNSNFYGSPRSLIDRLKDGHSFIAITDRHGINNYKQVCGDVVVAIWISPTSAEELKSRLVGRGTEDESALQKRLDLALAEIDSEKRDSLCSHHIQNDEDLCKAVQQFVEVIKKQLKSGEDDK